MRTSGLLRQIGLISAVGGISFAQSGPSTTVVRSGQFVAGAPSAWFSVAPGELISPQTTTGTPYSAEVVTEHTQTLADGTHITQTTLRSKIFHDSQGRTRNEDSLHIPGQAADFPSFIRIDDPVAGYLYTLDPRRHTARRITSRPMSGVATNRVNATFLGTPSGKTATMIADPSATRPIETGRTAVLAMPSDSAAGAPHPEMTSESLGMRMIEGVQATGTRTTTTYPEGFFGNDRPLTTTSEIWNSPDLKTMVLMTNSDPRSGETTTRMTDIVQAEPDASLFEVPSDYQLLDQGMTGGVISFDAVPAKQ
jgi:hypothetical protein